jgi:hypothetical protein
MMARASSPAKFRNNIPEKRPFVKSPHKKSSGPVPPPPAGALSRFPAGPGTNPPLALIFDHDRALVQPPFIIGPGPECRRHAIPSFNRPDSRPQAGNSSTRTFRMSRIRVFILDILHIPVQSFFQFGRRCQINEKLRMNRFILGADGGAHDGPNVNQVLVPHLPLPRPR